MTIPKQFIPLIETDMLDASVSSQLGSNPNIVKVNTVADFIGTNKTFEIRSNFTLTANLVLPDGSKIINGGGTINVGTFDVTFVNTNLVDSQWNFSTGTINDTSTFKDMSIAYLENFGAIGDGVALTNTGTDNRNVFMQFAKLLRIAQCDMGIKKRGNYYYTPITPDQDESNIPDNFYVTGNTNIYLGNGVEIGALTAPTISYRLIEFWKSSNAGIYGRGALLRGDLRTHDFVTYPGSDYCHAVKITNNSNEVIIDVPITEFSGDGANCGYNPEFYHYNTVIETAFTKDFTINSDGTTTANTDFAYSQRWSMTNFQDEGYFVFGGSSYSGTFGLDVQEYGVAFYNSSSIDGDTTTGFLSKLDLVETYQRIPLPEGTTHIRLIINTPSVWGDLIGTIYAPNLSSRVILKSPSITWCTRQGWSNLPPFSIIDGVTFDYIGRRFDLTPGTPGYAGDQEDGYQNLTHVTIRNCIFRNCKGGFIIFKGSRYSQVYNNKYLYESVPDWNSVPDISFANSEYTSSYGNVYQNKQLSLGRGNDIYGEIFKDVTLLFTYENERVHDIPNGENVYLNDMTDSDFTGKAYLYNSKFVYTKPLNAAANVFIEYRNVDIENVIFDFQGQTYNSTTHKLNNQAGIEEALGSLTKTKLINLTGETPSSDAFHMYVYNVSDVEIETNVSVRRGQPKEVTVSNLKVTGWFDLGLTDYPATGVGTFTTYKLVNPTIIAGSGVGTGGRDAFTVALKDVNVEVEGGYIEFPSSNLMFDFNNYGTRIFTGTTFYSATTRTQALTGFEFIDCNFENITLTGVIFKYSKPNPNCPSYADNATALAALGEGWVYKNTTTGKFDTTNL